MGITWWKRKEGFTLVELLVVIAIIGILATLLILQLGVARQRARDAQRISHINQVRTALEFYYDANDGYPASGDLAGVAIYLQGSRLPVDPTTGNDYGYLQISTVKYHLWSELEQKTTALNSDLDYDSSTGGGTNGASEVCDNTDLTDFNCVYDVGQTN